MSKDKKIELSPVIFMVVTAVLILGILCGVLAARGGAGAQEAELTALFGASPKTVFWHSFLRQAAWCAVMVLGAISPFLIPIVFLGSFAKGFFYGYTAGFLVHAFSLRGFFILCAGVAVHNFLSLSILTFYAAFVVTRSAECWLNRKNYYFKQRQNRLLAIVSSAVIASLALVSLCECAMAHLVSSCL